MVCRRSLLLAWLILAALLFVGCKSSRESGAVDEQAVRLDEARFKPLELESHWWFDLELDQGETLAKVWITPRSLYCLTSENKLHRLDREKGITTWIHQPAAPKHVVRQPVEVGDKVLVIAQNVAKIYDVVVGTLLDEYELPFGVGTDPAFDGQVMYVPDAKDSVRAVDLDSRLQLWTCRARMFISARPSLKGRTLVSVSESGEVLAYNTATYQRMWDEHFMTRNAILTRPILTDDGRCYIAGTDTLLYCLDTATGNEYWRYFAGWSLSETPTVTDGRIYLSVPRKGLITLDSLSGEELKDFRFAEKSQYLGRVDDRIYIIEPWRKMVSFNAQTGRRLDEVKLIEFDFFLTSTDPGKLYIATDGGRIVCLQKLGTGMLRLEDLRPGDISE